MIALLSRSQLDATAWDACVAASSQQIVYGYSWYLDAVLPTPAWKWVGLAQIDEVGQYRAVMPIPLRRKRIAGVLYRWVVHQPFFCQVLGVFSCNESLDPQPFFDLMTRQFRYGSSYVARRPFANTDQTIDHRFYTTHILNLQVGYEALYQNYTRDRKLNLRRAVTVDWTIVNSADPEPLLDLFRKYHAATIEGGVAGWAYSIFRNLVDELRKRGLIILRYAMKNERIEAGALFVCANNRVIYLFNAASPVGRRGNARTLLIDQCIREKAGQKLLFDFESPMKLSVRDFYQSFGTTEEPFLNLRWNRLNSVEKAFLTIRTNWLKKQKAYHQDTLLLPSQEIED